MGCASGKAISSAHPPLAATAVHCGSQPAAERSPAAANSGANGEADEGTLLVADTGPDAGAAAAGSGAPAGKDVLLLPGAESLPESPVFGGAVHCPSAPALHEAAAETPPGRAEHGAADGAAEGGADAEGKRRNAPPRRRAPSKTVPATFFKGVSYNGFKAVPEVLAFSCSEESCAPFTLPAEAITYEPAPQTVVTTFRNGDHERKIHCNIRLSELELERLALMRGEARAQGVEFSPSVTAMATRYLSRARMDPKKALKLMKETQEWRQHFFRDGPITDDAVREDMQHGIVYFAGRDCALRPLIVIRAARIPQQWYKERRIDKFINVLIYSMEYFLRYMVVPGRVENLSVLVDLQGLGISQVPIRELGEVYKILGHHYIGRVFKFYACNVSAALSLLASSVKVLLTDRQKQKLNILDDVSELRKEFALHQLEEDLGGSRPKITRFFPYPLNPGPFTAGYAGGPDGDAVPCVHEALTMGGTLGRLWDPKESAEDNTKLEYGPKAVAILKRCNIPIPHELILERETSAGLGAGRSMESVGLEQEPAAVEKPAKAASAASLGDAETCSNPDEETDVLMDPAELGLDSGIDTSPPRLEESTVCGGGGFFCCRL